MPHKPRANKEKSENGRKSTRWEGFDYRNPGSYFITVCAFERRHLFGSVIDSRVELSPLGTIVEKAWAEAPLHRPHLKLGAYVVMPNHFHGMLTFLPENPAFLNSRRSASYGIRSFSTPLSGSVSTAIGAFKAAVTYSHNNLIGHRSTVWQRGFHDRVVRSEEEYWRITRYIKANPSRWERDRHNPDRVGEDEFDVWLDLLGEQE
jgi:REP element-mobilizing transposase RayT